jgi:plasmid stabilization system protein ParE
LTDRRVRFTRAAARHVKHEHTWWLANRDYKDLFTSELQEAVRILGVLPGAGTPYPRTPVPGLRRIYVRAIGCHLYYTFDETEVTIRALWPARRERGPRLR